MYQPAHFQPQIRKSHRDRCCYCKTSEALSGIRMAFDHIHPRSKGGETCFENVCLACRSCNEFKANSTTGQDLLTQQIEPLFNPRLQDWHQHFAWSDDGTRVEGVTARAPVLALQMNNAAILAARKRWVSVG
ncbi:HNH endonuclease [Leptolyngbya sp. KIOST-1]|uniref:HNH endonuclease n=1 Tax=Leptolyngbya sp. KIOST-1 TaxID=1229172 RepID=UPI0005607395|nr:HNH endonuclease [Leptolyngbya sp. KIOST-1]